MKKKLLLLIPAVFIVAVIAAGVWLYSGTFTAAKQNIFKKYPLPVAIVDKHFISGKEFVSRFELAKSLLQSGQDFKENEVKDQILTQLIENDKLEVVAKQYNIAINQDTVNKEYDVFVKNFAAGDESKFTEMLKQTYRLTPDEFKTKVLRPDLLTTAITVWHNKQQNLNQDAFNKNKQIQDKLNSGANFIDVAKELSDDESTKQLGGDTGVVSTADLLPEFQTELKDAKAGDQKQIISRYGIHTVKVVDIDNTNASDPKIHLQQIFVKEDTYDKWYADESGKIKTRKLIKF